MAQEAPRPAPDPWKAFGYLVAGVLFYGGLGWLLDRWLGTQFIVALGILFGTAMGIYMTWSALRSTDAGPRDEDENRRGDDE